MIPQAAPQLAAHRQRHRRRLSGLAGAGLGLLLWLTGCHSIPVMTPVDLAAPGWRIQHVQAVWRPRQTGPELAGEILLARDGHGHFLVQFNKIPFPLVEAEGEGDAWRIRFVPEDRKYGGRGDARGWFGWLVLPLALETNTLPRGWHFTAQSDGGWHLQSSRTGESIEGYLAP